MITSTSYQMRFSRDENGRYCPPSASNTSPVFAKLEIKHFFKCAGQSRLCLEVVAVKLRDETVLGRKSRVLDYTNHRHIGIKEWKRRINDEINRVRGSTSDRKRSKWVDTTEWLNKNESWEDDPIKCLPRVGKAGSPTHKTLNRRPGVHSITGLSAASPDNLTPYSRGDPISPRLHQYCQTRISSHPLHD